MRYAFLAMKLTPEGDGFRNFSGNLSEAPLRIGKALITDISRDLVKQFIRNSRIDTCKA